MFNNKCCVSFIFIIKYRANDVFYKIDVRKNICCIKK